MATPHRIVALQSTSIFEAFGGIEYYLDDLLTLASAHEQSRVVAVVPKRERFQAAPRTYEVEAVAFRASGFLRKIENRLSPDLLAASVRWARAIRPDWVVSGHASLGPLAFATSRLSGRPYLTIAYGIECWGDLAPQNELALRGSARILSISHWTKKVLVDRGYDADRICIVHPQLPTEYENLPVPDRVAKKDGPFRLLTVSRLDAREQYKGQDHVIEALARLRQERPELEFHYVIQGDGTDRPRLEKLVAEKALGDCVEFRGVVAERSEFAGLYRNADAYVMPSRFGKWDGSWRGEGFGIVYVEAAAFGVPSIAYDCGGATDIIVDGETGHLVPPDDIDALARSLADLAQDREKARAWGLNAYRHVMASFTRPTISHQLEQALIE